MSALISIESERETEQRLNKCEKELADERLRRYRCENLFWRLWGLPVELAEAISAAVYGVKIDRFTLSWHRNPKPIVGFKTKA